MIESSADGRITGIGKSMKNGLRGLLPIGLLLGSLSTSLSLKPLTLQLLHPQAIKPEYLLLVLSMVLPLVWETLRSSPGLNLYRAGPINTNVQ